MHGPENLFHRSRRKQKHLLYEMQKVGRNQKYELPVIKVSNMVDGPCYYDVNVSNMLQSNDIS